MFLFVSPRGHDARYARSVERLKAILAEHGAGWLDLQGELAAPDAEAPAPAGRSGLPRPAGLELLARWLHCRRVQRQELFLDDVHPSRRGNALIAERVYRYLLATLPLRDAAS